MRTKLFPNFEIHTTLTWVFNSNFNVINISKVFLTKEWPEETIEVKGCIMVWHDVTWIIKTMVRFSLQKAYIVKAQMAWWNMVHYKVYAIKYQLWS